MQDSDRFPGKMRNLILGVSSCVYIGNAWTYEMVPVGHHVMAFIPILYLSKVHKNKIKVLYVCTLFLLLQKLLIKAGISWLDCFVKRTNDHQDEVTPSLTANEESQT